MSEGPTTTTTTLIPTRDVDWWAGHEDGIVGQTWLEHRRMLNFEAEREHAIERGEIEKRIARSRADLISSTERAKHEDEAFRAIEKQLTEARQDRDRDPNQYSRPMGAAFLACAVAIVGADYWLSRTIAEQILHSKAAALFSHANFVALGIVAMGLFFKLTADPFMRPRYLMPPYLRRVSLALSIIIGIIIALGLASVLAMLGIFRGETMKRSPTTTTATVYGSSTIVTPPPAPQPTGLANTLFNEDVGTIAKVTFLALALVLPIIGGIFAATGTARLHNAGQLQRFERTHEARKASHEELARQVQEKSAEVAVHERDLATAQSRAVLADRRYHTYLHGYERGLCAAQPNTGIAGQILQFVYRWVTAAHQRENFIRTTNVANQQLARAVQENACDAQPS